MIYLCLTMETYDAENEIEVEKKFWPSPNKNTE